MDRFRSGAVQTAGALVYPKAAYGTVMSACLLVAAFSLFVACFIRESHGRTVCTDIHRSNAMKLPVLADSDDFHWQHCARRGGCPALMRRPV